SLTQPPAPEIPKPGADTRPLEDILSGLDGYWAVLVAHDLKLFSLLAEHPRTLSEVCARLQLAPRAAEALLSLCSSLGLAQVQDGHYLLTPVAEEYLLES